MRRGTSVASDDRTLTVRVPISVKRRGGRKLVLAPDGKNITAAPVVGRIDSAMVKAVARAFRWRDMLESGEYATIREIAEVEKINQSYLCRILRLTLLAPKIVEAILHGRQPAGLMLANLMQPFPVGWQEQVEGWISARRSFGLCARRRNGVVRADSPVSAKRCAKRSFYFSK